MAHGWEEELAALERTLTATQASRPSAAAAPSHVHGATTPRRREVAAVPRTPVHNWDRKPAPPPQFGGPAYPSHLLPEERDAVPVRAAQAPASGLFGDALGDLNDLRPSYPRPEESGEFQAAPPPPSPISAAPLPVAVATTPAPLPGPPPAAATRRGGVRLLSAVPDHVVQEEPVPPGRAAPLAEILAQASEAAGRLQGLLARASEMLRVQAAPEPSPPPAPVSEVTPANQEPAVDAAPAADDQSIDVEIPA